MSAHETNSPTLPTPSATPMSWPTEIEPLAKANVKLVGFADYPSLGPTHSELDGKKLMSIFKNIKSYFPKNGKETKKYIKKINSSKNPCFLSLKADPDQVSRITKN